MDVVGSTRGYAIRLTMLEGFEVSEGGGVIYRKSKAMSILAARLLELLKASSTQV